jgi:hypothetical protein
MILHEKAVESIALFDEPGQSSKQIGEIVSKRPFRRFRQEAT